MNRVNLIANKFFGDIKGMAKSLDCSRTAIYLWRGVIPKPRLFELESLTKGRVNARKILKEQEREKRIAFQLRINEED